MPLPEEGVNRDRLKPVLRAAAAEQGPGSGSRSGEGQGGGCRLGHGDGEHHDLAVHSASREVGRLGVVERNRL